MRTLTSIQAAGPLGLALIAALAAADDARAQCPSGNLGGKIETCAEDGSSLPADSFDQACDVYLRATASGGGPQSALPAGDYVFQVTDPSGATLLSQAGPQNGVLSVSSGQPGFTAYSGSHQTAGSGALADLRVQLCPMAPTPNPGGVCKVWITPLGCYEPGKGAFGFQTSKSKTLTFKVTGSAPPQSASLVVRRFCDSDADGGDAGERMQNGVRYVVSISTVGAGLPFELLTGTAGPGTARLDDIPVPATYTVCELVPGAGEEDCWWYGTVPGFAGTSGEPPAACFSGALDADETETLSFGAACVCRAHDGMSRSDFLGRSGRALLRSHDPQWRDLLDAAELVTADGSPFTVPAGNFRGAFGHFAAWMDSDGSPNTAHSLSTEAAATLLAEHFGALDTRMSRVLRPGQAACLRLPTATSRDLLARAEAQIRSDAFTPVGDRTAVEQGCLRDALAGVNTNAAPILNDHCCASVYP
jgi:hypothetical protein